MKERKNESESTSRNRNRSRNGRGGRPASPAHSKTQTGAPRHGKQQYVVHVSIIRRVSEGVGGLSVHVLWTFALRVLRAHARGPARPVVCKLRGGGYGEGM